MTYVITQSCCNDATCVMDCPVDCIRPTPGDPEFINAEMLYIDPDSCIDCGACQDACPVSAVYPEDDLPSHLRHFTEFNASYFTRHPLEPSSYTSDRPAAPAADHGTLRVAVVGSGPAAAYLAEDLLERGNVRVDMIERLPTPWGLLRAGVAPDHLSTKDLTAIFDRPFKSDAFEYHLNVEVGQDITVEELRASHHAVVLATGAADPTPWNIPGADLSGVHPATDFVAWYNGHPDHADANFDLSCERAVIIGNGNVALDVARILLLPPERLNSSDVAEHALVALASSKIREVVIVGRRGPVQAAYTAAEFHALANLPEVDVVIAADEAALDPTSRDYLSGGDAAYEDGLRAELASRFAATEASGASRRVVFRFLADAVSVLGERHVEGVRFRRNELVERDGQVVTRAIDADPILEKAGLVLTSIGYRGRAIPGVPFDAERGTIPSDLGRVLGAHGEPVPGLYTAGWAKRGAKGGIGAGRADAQETAAAIVADFNAGVLAADGADLAGVLAAKDVEVVTGEGWTAIDSHERAAGIEAGRPRQKLVRIPDMVRVAQER